MLGERGNRGRESQLKRRRNVVRYDSKGSINSPMLATNVRAKAPGFQYLVAEIQIAGLIECPALLVGQNLHQHRFGLFGRKRLLAIHRRQLPMHAKQDRDSRWNVYV